MSRRLTVLVTRPEPEAAALAAALAARGHEALVEPLLRIEPVEPAPPLPDGVQAILATSANGVRAAAAATARRDLLLLAVGDASAEAARSAGFARVESADGAADDLARLVRNRLDPAAGPLAHARGEDVAGDLAGALGAAGFTVAPWVLYAARTAGGLSEATARGLAEGTLDAVLLFSPRTAGTLARLLRARGLAEACARIDAICLSDNVAEAAAEIRWRRVLVAARPTQEALLDRLADLNTAPSGPADAAGEAAPLPPSAPRPRPARGRAAAVALGIFALAVVLGGLAVATQPAWRDAAKPLAARVGLDLDALLGPLDEEVVEAPPAGEVTAEAPAEEAQPGDRGLPVDDPAMARLKGRVTAVEAALARLAGERATVNAGPRLAANDERLAELDRRLAVVVDALAELRDRPAADTSAAQPGSPPAAEAPDLAPRIAALESRVEALAQPSGGGAAADADRLAALEDRVERLAQAPAAPSEEAERRLAALEEAVRRAAERPMPDAGAIGGRVDSLAEAVGRLEARLAALGGRVAEAGASERQELERRLQSLSERLDSVAAEAGRERVDPAAIARLAQENAALKDEVSGLEARLAEVARSAVGEQAARRAGEAFLLAVTRLAGAARGDGGFAAELKAAEALAGDDPAAREALQALAARAGGVPSRVRLAERFEAAAPAILRAAVVGRDEGFLAEAWSRVAGLVSVRRTGAPAGDDAGAVVARAEAALGRGDLAAAVAEVETLAGDAAGAARPWLEAARARLAVDRALAVLEGRATARLAAGGAG